MTPDPAPAPGVAPEPTPAPDAMAEPTAAPTTAVCRRRAPEHSRVPAGARWAGALPHPAGGRYAGRRHPCAGAQRVRPALFAALFAAFALIVFSAAPAAAHAEVLTTTPAAGEVLQRAPGTVSVSFSEPVQTASDAIRVLASDGTRVDRGDAADRPGHSDTISATLRAGLGQGTYTVAWHVTSADSHPVHGAFAFTVGDTAVAAGPLAGADRGPDQVVAFLVRLARGAGYAGLALLLGAAGIRLLLRENAGSGVLGRQARAGGLVLTLSAAVSLLAQGPYAAGSGVSSLFDPDLLHSTLSGRTGIAEVLRVLLAAAVTLAVSSRRSPSDSSPERQDAPVSDSSPEREDPSVSDSSPEREDPSLRPGPEGAALVRSVRTRSAAGGSSRNRQAPDRRTRERIAADDTEAELLLPAPSASAASALAPSAAAPSAPDQSLPERSALQRLVPHGPSPDRTASPGAVPGRVASASRSRKFCVPVVLEFALLAALAATFSATGHAATGGHAAVAFAADELHLLAMGVWLGGLVALAALSTHRAASGPRTPAVLTTTVRRFSPLAAWCVAILAVTGTLQAVRQLGSAEDLLTTGWGRYLTAKLVTVLALLAVAYRARRWTRQHAERHAGSADGPAPAHLRTLRRTLAVEAAVGAVVLALSTLLAGSQPPADRPARTVAVAPAVSTGVAHLHATYDTGAAGGSGTAVAVLTPQRDGSVLVDLRLTGQDGAPAQPAEVTASLAQPARNIGPLPVELEPDGPGHWRAWTTLNPKGTWQFAVTVRSTDIDETTVTFPAFAS